MAERECIHGFEPEFCDICTPRRAPEPVRPVRRTAPSAERAPRAPRPAPVRAQRLPTFDPSRHRVFHVVHRDTLAGILADGALRADATPPVDLSTPLIRELRATVPATADERVSDRVAFALSDQASWWRDLRDGALDRTRWSDAARAARHADFVVLVATLGGLGDVVVTDADAASAVARFARTPEEIARTLARVRAGAGALEGEALAAGPVPFESIVLVGVANEPARESVRELLAAHGRRDVRVALSPEWLLPEV